MTKRFAAWLAAGLMLAPPSAQAQVSAQAPAETKVVVGDLIGLDEAAVRARLATVPADWTLAEPSLALATDHGVVDLVSGYYLTLDPAEFLAMEHNYSGDSAYKMSSYLQCRTFIGPAQDEDGLTLVFSDGRLSAVYRDPPPLPVPPVSVAEMTDTKAFLAAMKKPRPSAFIAVPGHLPLADGDAFIGRWSKRVLERDVELTTRCAPWHAPEVPESMRSAGVGPDIALAPLAVLEPPLNAGRIAARKNGRAVLAHLKVGAPLGKSLDDFAASTTGVRVFRDSAVGYAVIVLDMGAWSSNHLDNKDDVAMIGVEAGKVTWIMPSGWRVLGLGLSADLLCLDNHFVPGRVRAGCSDYGHYTP